MDMAFAEVGMDQPKQVTNTATGKGSGLFDQPPRNMTLSQMSGDRVVYRVIRRENAMVVSGWSQSPCGHCPRFDFCEDSGPINPASCQYYDVWLEPPENNPEEGGAEQEVGDQSMEDAGGPMVDVEI